MQVQVQVNDRSTLYAALPVSENMCEFTATTEHQKCCCVCIAHMQNQSATTSRVNRDRALSLPLDPPCSGWSAAPARNLQAP